MRKVLATALLVACAGTAHGQTMYATNNLAAANGFTGGGDQLITFDFQTAAWSPVGGGNGEIIDASGAPVSGLGGLDFNGDGSVLYAADSFGPTAGAIYSINPANAQATFLGNGPAAFADLAWDPNTNDLYGTTSSGALYRNVDDPANAVLVGNYNVGTLEVGIGFDSAGNIYVHDLISDTIYSGLAGSLTTLAPLHALPFDSNFSQGLYVDWSDTDGGFHGALNNSNLTSPNHEFGTLVTGGGYNATPSSVFATAGSGLPEVEVGDLTRFPVPAPSSLALLGLGGLAAARRRR